MLEHFLSEQCPLLQVCVCAHCSKCVCVCAHCSRCVCVPTAPSVCVCVCVPTAPGVCTLGWVKCREQISLLVILCIIMYVTTKKKKKKKKIQNRYFFFSKPIMVKCLNIGKNIGKPIYRSISNNDGKGCTSRWFQTSYFIKEYFWLALFKIRHFKIFRYISHVCVSSILSFY